MKRSYKTDPHKPQKQIIALAAEMIKNGGVVIFPTETVYGLGASPFNKKAVLKILALKGRSKNNPMAVIVSSIEEVRPLVKRISGVAKRLMKKHWPGPLTLVFEKSKLIPDLVTSGKKTIGIRMPSHKVALALVKECSIPIIATSANISGKKPSITARQAISQIKGADIVLDGGRSRIGLSSTVVDVSKEKAKVLRFGALKVRI